MKFNASKSKVIVIGKRLNKNKEWKLRNSMLIETTDYKYLGVYFSMSLSLSIDQFCRKQLTKLANLLMHSQCALSEPISSSRKTRKLTVCRFI